MGGVSPPETKAPGRGGLPAKLAPQALLSPEGRMVHREAHRAYYYPMDLEGTGTVPSRRRGLKSLAPEIADLKWRGLKPRPLVLIYQNSFHRKRQERQE